MKQLLQRAKWVTHVWLVALDQLAFVTFAGIIYIVTNGEAPSPQETISSNVGRMSLKGYRWAKALEKIINGIFYLLGDGKNHCQNAIVKETDWLDYKS